MSFADTMRVWSNLNCTLASLNSYGQDRLNGVSAGEAVTNLFGNMANGVVRNEIAYDMQLHGNPMGNVINSYAGYGNSASNAIGTMGLMTSCTPWMFFNCFPMLGCGYPMMGCGYPMMGYSMPMMGMPMFGVYGFC